MPEKFQILVRKFVFHVFLRKAISFSEYKQKFKQLVEKIRMLLRNPIAQNGIM